MTTPQDATSAETEAPATEAEDTEAQQLLSDAVGGEGTEDTEQLGDAGKQALDRMKDERNQYRSEARSWKKLAKELGVSDAEELRSMMRQSKPAEETPDPEQLRKQARDEAQEELLKERALDKIEVKAAKTFADPEDAKRFLADRVDEFVEDGKVDAEAIGDALEELAKNKPYLAAQGGKRFQGSADGGARKGPQQPSQLTRDDLKGLTPEQVVAAKEAGQLKDLLGDK